MLRYTRTDSSLVLLWGIIGIVAGLLARAVAVDLVWSFLFSLVFVLFACFFCGGNSSNVYEQERLQNSKNKFYTYSFALSMMASVVFVYALYPIQSNAAQEERVAVNNSYSSYYSKETPAQERGHVTLDASSNPDIDNLRNTTDNLQKHLGALQQEQESLKKSIQSSPLPSAPTPTVVVSQNADTNKEIEDNENRIKDIDGQISALRRDLTEIKNQSNDSPSESPTPTISSSNTPTEASTQTTLAPVTMEGDKVK